MFENFTDQYHKAATNYCIQNSNFIIGFKNMSDADKMHVYSIAASVMMTRDSYLTGGGFVSAIINNDLYQAVTRADSVCINAIKIFVMVKHNLYIKIDRYDGD